MKKFSLISGMKFFLLLAVMFLVSLNSFAAYLTFEPVTITQPNGVSLNVFASGDEFYNWLHDKDGYTIIQDVRTGYYCFAVSEGTGLKASRFVVGEASPLLAGMKPWLTIPESEILKKRLDFYDRSPKDMGDAPKTGVINNLVVYITVCG